MSRRGVLHDEGFLFPHPPRNDTGILAVVVEKKGDETRTSMRQSEIYAYSYEIIIRDGYMVMPKITWNDFEPGDWFACKRLFSLDRNGRQKEERELYDLHKITAPSAISELKIPPTRFVNGNVQIVEDFILCPDFIRNRESSNSYGRYKKIFIRGIGQGFVHSVNDHLIKAIKPGRVYVGILEFRAKDNGAVNFGHRNEIRDHTGHVLERDAMWELVQLTANPEKLLSEHELMKKEIETLKTDAQKFDEEILAKISKQKMTRHEQTIRISNDHSAAQDPTPPRHHLSRDPTPSRKLQVRPPTPLRQCSSSATPRPRHQLPTGNVRVDTLRAELNHLIFLKAQGKEFEVTEEGNTSIFPPSTEQYSPENTRYTQIEVHNSSSAPDRSNRPNRNVFQESHQAVSPVVIQNLQQLETHRSKVIMQATFQEAGSCVQMLKWIDRETNETSTDCDILNYKFDVRHGRFDDPPFGVALAVSYNIVPSPNLHDISTFSNITAVEREPLAASTPRTSPSSTRRQFFGEPNPAGPQLAQSAQSTLSTNVFEENNNDVCDADETITAAIQDNNANPPARRRFTFADLQL